MSGKRFKKRINELNDALKFAVKTEDFFKQSEIEFELAELWRDNNLDTAISHYECALKCSKRAKHYQNIVLAYRNLGEIYIRKTEAKTRAEKEYKQAFKYLELQLQVAEENNDHGLIQLAYHTLAQNYYVGAQRFDIESINLTKALHFGRKCLDYLNAHQQIIDDDENATKTGENSNRRRAGINSVLADIYCKFGAVKEAVKKISAAIEYALKHAEKLEPIFLYQCYFVKLELLNGRQCLELLDTMRIYANKHKIKENWEILERKYYIQSLTSYAQNSTKFCEVVEYFLKQYDKTGNTDDFTQIVLKFLYSLMMLKKLLSATVTNNDRSLLYEDLGDKACAAEFFELGMGFYKEMLRYAELDKNSERVYLACGSIVETARNLQDYKLAHSTQERVLRLVHDLYPKDLDKIFFDECDLLFLDIRLGYNVGANKDVQYSKFLSIIQKCDSYRKKATLIDEFVLFLAFYDDKKELRRWCDELKKIYRLSETEPSASTYEEKSPPSLERQELYKLRKFVSDIRNMKEKADVSWRNNKGETRLHEAAKVDDVFEIEQLIRNGHNVNAVDYAGWTPLMEAVSFGHIGNVRVLCQNGANVNAASSEGLVDEDGNVGPSGITPLMDACGSGKIAIARLLLRFNADLDLLNEKQESAIDLIRSFIQSNLDALSEKELAMCQALLTDLERRSMKRSSQSSVSLTPEASQENIKRFCNGYNFSA